MDLTSSVPNPGLDLHPNLEPIRQLIKPSSRASSPGSVKSSQSNSASFHHTLAGLILLPGSTGYPTGPLATLPPTDLIDTVNTRLLSPILTVQQFLPLLALAETQAQSSAATSTTKAAGLPLSAPSVILAYSSIPTSLHPPHQIPETITTTSLSSFARSLDRELHPKSNISITEIKFGFFDLGSVLPRAPRAGDYVYPQHIREREQGQERSGPEVPRNSAFTHWHSSQRAAAQRSIHGQQQEGSDSGNYSKIRGAGSSLREFHNAVFDTLNPSPGFKAFGVVSWGRNRRRRIRGTVYVGQGARLYDLAGKWIPEGLVGWLIRRQETRIGEVEDSRQGTERSNVDGARERGQEIGLPRWGASSASSGSGVWEKL